MRGWHTTIVAFVHGIGGSVPAACHQTVYVDLRRPSELVAELTEGVAA
jgi:hypothetical protein